MPSPGSLDAPSLFWSPLAEHGAHHLRIRTGARGLVNSLPSVCLKSLRLAPPRQAAPGQVGVGGEPPLEFAAQQTFPGLGQEDTAKCGLMASHCSLHY